MPARLHDSATTITCHDIRHFAKFQREARVRNYIAYFRFAATISSCSRSHEEQGCLHFRVI